jgi:hypothetical protein
MNLTDEQQKIVTAPLNQSLIINAVPGSGKTTVMIHRIVHMIKHYKVDPKSIAMFTYNKSLGSDMSNKLEKLGINPKSLFWCNTLHSFCYQTTRDYQDLKPWLDRYENENFPRYTARGFPLGYDPTNSLKYVIFDEFQDCDSDIASVVKVLSKNKHLMIVGDNRQQLYAYRGADINHLRNIKNDFVEYVLSKTFRCNQNICTLLNKIWTNAPATHSVIHSDIEGPKPNLYRSRGSAMNNPDITNEIVKLVEKYHDGSIAIISPTINSDTSRRFLNDVHSNIFDKCKITFNFSENSDKESKYIISSVHASKGLEYDTVILLNAIDNKYFFDYPTYEAQCKFFVACSRTKQNLFLFEHNYHFSNGSIKWITENENLFNKLEDDIWNAPVRQRPPDISGKIEKNCRDYIRGLSNEQRRNLLNQYGPIEKIKSEEGLIDHVGDPALCGLLIEMLFATKLHFDLKFDFKPYVTSDEWSAILKNKDIPTSVLDKIKEVYPYEDINIRRKVDGGKVRIIILFIDKNKVFNSWRPSIDLNSMVETKEITENHIISNFMCDEYYKHLSLAHDVKNSILKSDSLDEEYVENLWWMLRFQRLMDMSLTGFNQPDLSKDDINKVLHYINNSKVLSDLHVVNYHTHYRSEVEVETWVNGEVDFESDDAFIELKCVKSDDLDEAWLQVMVYNQISEMKHKRIYVYNAITGTLYQRKVK